MMRIKLIMRFVFVLLLVLNLVGCSVKGRIKKADKKFAIGEYFSAGDLYKNVFSSISSKDKPLRARIAFNQGESYRLISHTRAEMAYQLAVRNLYSDSIVYLRYAQVLQRNAKYAEAIKNYKIYLLKDPTNEMARNGIFACEQMAEWKKNATRYEVVRATEFNASKSSSFSPAFIGSSDAIVFTSSRQINKKTSSKNSAITGLPVNKIFSSKKNALGKWETPVLLEGDVNTLDDEGICSFSSDGKIMYFTRSPHLAIGEKGTEIFVSNRAGGTWSAPKKIKIFKDSTVSVAHPAISPDGSTLYFVSDSKEGFGGKDIWKATLQEGECKFIENLGPDINSSGDEMFPYIKSDGTLYYSSNGKPGFGGLDLFKATPIDKDRWKIENMGQPMNSNSDDYGITFAGAAEKGFFSSNRADSKSYDAIWHFELPELSYVLEGKVLDEDGLAIPDASIKLVTSSGVNAKVQSKKDGTYRMRIDKDVDCVMLATSRGYLNQKNGLSTKGLIKSQTFSIDFKLVSISKPVKMDNIFYEFGKWDLTPSSTVGLQTLVKLLTDNPNIAIEISANTDFVGNNAANKLLSEKRAKSVVDYLIAAGIYSDRLSSVGNGEENPVVVDKALSIKYPFLKEGAVLDETFIASLTPEEQDIASQINRRTEFRVTKTTYKLF